jgi:hypothetical protein
LIGQPEAENPHAGHWRVQTRVTAAGKRQDFPASLLRPIWRMLAATGSPAIWR